MLRKKKTGSAFPYIITLLGTLTVIITIYLIGVILLFEPTLIQIDHNEKKIYN